MTDKLVFFVPNDYYKVVKDGRTHATHFDTKVKAKAYREQVPGSLVKRSKQHPKGETF